jgi:hypothetical protein
MTGSAASGSWENFSIAGEHVYIATWLLKQLYKNDTFPLTFLSVAWKFQILGYWISGS